MLQWIKNHLGTIFVLIAIGLSVYYISQHPFTSLPVVMDLLKDPLFHFFLAFLLALLPLRLIVGTLSVLYRISVPGMSQRTRLVVAGGIMLCCLSALISIGLLSHYYLDLLPIWWDAPLGEHLDLEY
jgi:hypothetical protein